LAFEIVGSGDLWGLTCAPAGIWRDTALKSTAAELTLI
jgi:hypothetical protein